MFTAINTNGNILIWKINTVDILYGVVNIEIDYEAFSQEYTEKLAIETQIVGAVKDVLDFIRA
jgi:hypothetical protein